jgi:hypothetical protein
MFLICVLVMSYYNTKWMTHLKEIKSLLQSCLALLEQRAHLALTEKSLDFATLLLSFNKCMYFVEGPNSGGQDQPIW